MKSEADVKIYKKCDKCGMRGMKLLPGLIRRGITSYVVYKCVYCHNKIEKEI